MLCGFLTTLLAIPTAIWLLSYFIPVALTRLLPPVDIKKKYKASWALVTGAGTGIGRSLAVKLASQGLNVVLVSLPDEHLQTTTKQLQQQFPNQEFRAVGANFSVGANYMEDIIKATEDIDVQAIFNNAGYIVTGFFEQQPLQRQLNNVECNATASVAVTHHFLKKLIDKNLKGCIVFTSSVSGYIPNPFATMYGATKAFVSQFAASLAVEVSPLGIDVCAVHPSPVASNFYDNSSHQIDMLDMAKKSAVSPDQLPNDILRCIGRVVLGDLGGMAVGVRAGTFFAAYNFLASVFSLGAPFMPDFKKYNKDRVKA